MEPKIVLNGVDYPVIPRDDWTLGESADAEDICGQGYDFEKLGAKGILALAYIAARRVNPSVTLEDLKSLKYDDVDFKGAEGKPVPPPSPGESAGSENTGSEDSSASSDGSPAGQPEPTGTPA
jgi:hypothetical protein